MRNQSAALTKWMPSGPTREVICVKRGKDAAMLAGRPASEHSQIQTEGRTLQLHKSLCLCLYFIWQEWQLCKQASSQHVKWGLERWSFYCLPGSRDERAWLESLPARERENRLDVQDSEKRVSVNVKFKETCLCVYAWLSQGAAHRCMIERLIKAA